MCLRVYGGSHSPPNRPPVLIFRAVRRDLAALAPLATGPHGRLDFRAVLARCLRGHQRYAPGSCGPPAWHRRSDAAGATLAGGLCGPVARPCRHGSPPSQAAGTTVDHTSTSDAPAACPGPPQPWPCGLPSAPALPPAPWGSGPGGPLPGGGHYISAAAPASCQGLQALPGCAALDSRPGPPHRVIIRGGLAPPVPSDEGPGKIFHKSGALAIKTDKAKRTFVLAEHTQIRIDKRCGLCYA